MKRETNRRKGENKKGGLGNDCSNHRLQLDVLSGATVNLSVSVCVFIGLDIKRVHLRKLVVSYRKAPICFHIETLMRNLISQTRQTTTPC